MKFYIKLLSFFIAGGIGATIELISFNFLYLLFNFPISKLLALVFALSVNFTINRNITFSASSVLKRRQIPRYILVYSIAIVINYMVSVFSNSLLPEGFLYANLAVALGILIGLPITFLGSQFWVFKKPKTPPQ